ncbi:MAG: hypothetical protein ACKOBW_09925 [Planctomycetota bacterium]
MPTQSPRAKTAVDRAAPNEAAAARSTSTIRATSTARSVASLLLAIHLFCVLVALAANPVSSPLQRSLLAIFRPYTRLLNFDHPLVRYDLTQGTADDAESRLEYRVLEGRNDTEAWSNLRAGMRGSDRAERYRRWANWLNFAAQRDDSHVPALLGQALGQHLLAERQQELVELRGRRHLLQTPADLRDPQSSRANPDDAAHFLEVYRGQAIVDRERQEVLIQRAEERGQVAPTWSATPASGARP